MAEKQVKDYEKFVVRFPDGMRDAIAERAKQNGRSMNSEIVQILEDALENRPVKVQSEMNIDLFAEQGVDDDRIVISKSQLLEKVDTAIQEAIEATAEHMAIKMAEAALDSLSSKYDFVPKSKKPT
ncbi:Arc family DNA-binding protein [Salmonella enterica]|nr:Arc family DNA-binding protein [Salmonella enterica]EBB2873501.1 Arc family DNA-binding protein [Salmonella enterica]EBB3916495.1 Arc family DNA-binding protein [Salmonella enterica]EBB3958014.1 Arc family DNA-binding protein [Salmonella enterica]EBB3967342.1 Arc family DNA-binding protein [Salmonella enterica]